jgi:carboxypeptidase Taq
MHDTQADLQTLRDRLREVSDLKGTAYVLSWDQSTYMPQGGADARARKLALLEQLAHERLTAPSLGDLLHRLDATRDALSPDDAALVTVALKDHLRASRVPASFVARREAHLAKIYHAWNHARSIDDFQHVAPMLETSLDLARELATFFPDAQHPADPLIDEWDPGASAVWVRALFSELRARLVPLVQAVCAPPTLSDNLLRQHYPHHAQLDFTSKLAERLGYDFERGRQDLAPHPFMIRFSGGDVRITTRVDELDLSNCLYSVVHEAGHAMYEQGIRSDFDGTPLGHGASAGLHESQSRLWENLVARSLPFCEFILPDLKAAFPQQLADATARDLYRAINKVQPSLIRTESDELTYNLHVLVRFELEQRLLNRELPVADLPDAWRDAYQHSLGVIPDTHRDGPLQDIHWYCALPGGAFQGYTLGNLMSAQLMNAARLAHPDLDDRFRQGDFSTLLGWLREHVHQHGRARSAQDILHAATGKPLGLEDYLGYLRAKYSDLYQTELPVT